VVAQAHKGERRNTFYETMREVSPGDLIFAFVDTFIVAIGVAHSYCWGCPKTAEFGTAGQKWEDAGWKVRVQFTPIVHRVRPKDHMSALRPVLPPRYAPLHTNGNGIQSDDLTGLPQSFAEVLAGLIGTEAQSLIGSAQVGAPMQTNDDLDWWEHPSKLISRSTPRSFLTDRQAIIRARRGQGIFKQRVMEIEQQCSDYGSHEPGPPDREPLQAVARRHEHRVPQRRERSPADTEH
jgi:hypothetical protein